MKKKICCMILGLSMLLTVGMSGCGKDESAGEGVKPPEDIWGAYDQQVTVKLAVPSTSLEWPRDATGDYSYSDNVWTQSWLEDFNIKAEIMWDANDSTKAYEQKLNMSILSKDLPDIIVTSNYSQFMDLYKSGQIQPIGEVVEKYGYDYLKENLAKNKGLASGTFDGKQYGIPLSSADYRTRLIFMRKDWMEQLKIAAPKSMDDVIAAGKKFVDAGLARYALPIYTKFGDGMGDIQAVANSMGAFPRCWVNDNGTLSYGSVQPKMKDTLSLYADLYKQGYIDKGFSSLDSGALATQITSGQIGVLPADYWVLTWPLNNMWTEKEQVDWNIYPVMPHSTNKTDDFKIQGGAFNGKVVCVNSKFKNPEALMKLLNFNLAMLDDPERAQTSVYHSDMVNDKPISFFTMNPLYVILNDPMTNYNTQKNITAAVDNGMDKTKLVSAHDKTQFKTITNWFTVTEVGNAPSGSTWSVYKMFYGANSAFGIYNDYIANNRCIFSADEGYQTETMVRQWSSMIDLEDQYFTEIIAGSKPLSAFDELVSSWKSLGGENITKELNDWYANGKNK